MIKVVLDTNIYISAILFGGKPEQILELASQGKITLVVSPAILAELAEVLSRKFKWDDYQIRHTLSIIHTISYLVSPSQKIKASSHDPDNRIIEAALAGGADYIVSGDRKHLLPLKKYRNITIVSAHEFLDTL